MYHSTISWMMSGGSRDETADDRRMRQHVVALREAEAMRRVGWTLPFDPSQFMARLTERVAPSGPATLDCCAA